MSKSDKNVFDAIIIGAGISGLVCGCYLAKAGMKVLVVEQHDKPGGYCTSFKRKGFNFDAAAHSFGSYRETGNFRKILNEIGINNLISVKRYDPSDMIVTPDFTMRFSNNTKDTISHLSNLFPLERSNIKRYFNYFAALTTQNQSESIKLKDKTFASFLGSFFTDKALINAISFPVFGNGGLPPSELHAFTGTRIFNEFLIDGGYYPDGGIQNLPNAMDSVIRQNNGAIMYRKLVKKIIYQKDSVQGVILESGESFLSRYVVSACDMTETFRSLLSRKLVGSPFLNKIKTLTPSLSTFILYLGIDKTFKALPHPGTNVWYLPCYDMDRIYRLVKICDFDKVGAFMMRVSPDERTVLAFTLAPFKSKSYWRNHKKRVAQEFLARIEKFVPQLKSHIVYADAATPATLHRYTLNHKGANYGWDPTLSQLFDPDFRQKTCIKGLYLTGHWTGQTHGIPGVSYLGYNAAKLILRQEKIVA